MAGCGWLWMVAGDRRWSHDLVVLIYIIIDNYNKPLIIFQQLDAYLNEPIKIDEFTR